MNREEFAKRLEGIQIQESTDPKALYDSVLPISDALTQMMPQSLNTDDAPEPIPL